MGKSDKNKFLAYPGQTLTWTTLGQLCAALWDSQSRPVVIQPGIEPGSLVAPLALRCSALDRCSTQELSRLLPKSVPPLVRAALGVTQFCSPAPDFPAASYALPYRSPLYLYFMWIGSY